MTRILATALAAALLALPLAGQAQQARTGTITGFSSIPWGSPQSVITARYGQPRETARDGELRMIGYADRILGENVGMWFIVHPRHGLVGGQYVAPWTYGDSCWTLYTRFKNAISERYPGIEPQEEEIHNGRTMDWCTAIVLNRASALTVWDDLENDARAYVEVVAEPRHVIVWYLSAEGSRIIEERQARETRERF